MNATKIMLPTLKCHPNYGFHELYRFRFENSNRIAEAQNSVWKCILKNALTVIITIVIFI